MIRKQYSETVPEISLWQNVIARAVIDCRDFRKQSKIVQREAVQWIFFSRGFFNSFPELASFCNVGIYQVKQYVAEVFKEKGFSPLTREYAREIRKYFKGGYYDTLRKSGTNHNNFRTASDPVLCRQGAQVRA